MRTIVEQIANTQLPQEMKDISDDELRETFIKLGEGSESRVLGTALLEAYAKEIRRRKAGEV